jgi:hypothetical protein
MLSSVLQDQGSLSCFWTKKQTSKVGFKVFLSVNVCRVKTHHAFEHFAGECFSYSKCRICLSPWVLCHNVDGQLADHRNVNFQIVTINYILMYRTFHP